MEKNERLAWRTKPRTYCRCFSSCPKAPLQGRPFQLQIRKKQLFRPRKVVFFIFPSRHSWGGLGLSVVRARGPAPVWALWGGPRGARRARGPAPVWGARAGPQSPQGPQGLIHFVQLRSKYFVEIQRVVGRRLRTTTLYCSMLLQNTTAY